METDYSGVVGLAQAVLAVNMAYIALDKFRYLAEIREMFLQALELIDGMPPHYQDDMAYHNIRNIAEGSASHAWGGAYVGYVLYNYVFKKSLDWYLCCMFAVIASLILVVQAYDGLIANANMTQMVASFIRVPDILVNWLVFIALLGGLVVPVAFFFAGRHMINLARGCMKQCLVHFGKRLKNESGEDISAQLHAWGLEDGVPRSD